MNIYIGSRIHTQARVCTVLSYTYNLYLPERLRYYVYIHRHKHTYRLKDKYFFHFGFAGSFLLEHWRPYISGHKEFVHWAPAEPNARHGESRWSKTGYLILKGATQENGKQMLKSQVGPGFGWEF